MNKLSISRFAGFAAAAVIGLIFSSATANAQYRDPYYSGRNNGYNNSSYNNGYSSNIALENGYRLGFGDGSNDRAYGRSFDVDRSKVYRDADSGYSNSGFRDKDDYKSIFRQGYQQGYRNGYQSNNGNGRNNGYYGNNYPANYPNNRNGHFDNCPTYSHSHPQVNQRPGRRRGWDRNHPVFGNRR